MEKYDPLRKESAHRWVTGVAVANEIREGRGPITLDCTHFSADDIKLCKAVIPIIMENFEKAGWDITHDKIVYEADYAANISGGCGLRTDDRYQSTVPALYAGGAATTVVLNALHGCSITGWYSGESAAEHSMDAPWGELTAAEMEQAEALRQDIRVPLALKEGMSFEQAQQTVKTIMKDDIGIFHNEEGLKRAGEKLADLSRKLSYLIARDPHDLSRVTGIKNLVQTLELAVAAGRRRTESREGFVRDDYPETDNVNLKSIMMRRENGGVMRVWDEPVDIPGLNIKREKKAHIAFAGRS